MAQAKLFEGAGPEVFGDDIGLRNQVEDQPAAFGRLEIDRKQTPLAP